MRWKSCAWSYSILIDNAQSTKSHAVGVVKIAKRKGIAAIEQTCLGLTAYIAIVNEMVNSFVAHFELLKKRLSLLSLCAAYSITRSERSQLITQVFF
jgi:hypothetical protein